MSFLSNVNSNNVAKSFTLLPRLGILQMSWWIGSLCTIRTSFRLLHVDNMCIRLYFNSYILHTFGILLNTEIKPLLGVMSWNTGIRCMLNYI